MNGPPRLQRRASGFAKWLAYRTGTHRLVFPRYDFMFTPRQLAFLTDQLTATNHLDGAVLELGCAAGHTTTFLGKHLEDLGSTRRYIAIDTFAGFTAEDIAVERARGKTHDYGRLFRNYRKAYFDRTLVNNDLRWIEVIEADVTSFDFAVVGPVSFCVVDVDLYRPVRASLEAVLTHMQPGGVIVVDDCAPSTEYDGALEAYRDVVGTLGLEPDLVADLGVIRAPSTTSSAQT